MRSKSHMRVLTLFFILTLILSHMQCRMYKSADGLYSSSDPDKWDEINILNSRFESGLSHPPKRYITELDGTFNSQTLDGRLVHFHQPKFWNVCQEMDGVFLLGSKQFPFTPRPFDVFDGDYSIALVKTEHGENSIISQVLSKPLRPKAKYEMSMQTAFVGEFTHPQDTISNGEICFDSPPILKIWSTDADCDFYELLYESDPIINNNWQILKVSLSPLDTVWQIALEIDYSVNNASSTHLLLDHISDMKLNMYQD